MKQYINILLSLFLTITSCHPAFAQTKVDGSLLKGDVIGGTASNTRRLVVPKDTKTNLDAKTRLEANLVYGTDTKKAYIDNGTDLVAVGSGSGGETNYIVNGDADGASASIFIPYADAAATRPVDGTGGSPTVTTAITSTVPLVGAKSYLLTKPASNVQGQGWAIPFSVDLGYRAKASKITVSYIVNSGTFVAGSDTTESDVIWYLYDVTNSVLIEPSNIKMRASNTVISDLYDAEFQTSATGSSYRLIAHVQSTSALAYELKVDEIKISPNKVTLGPVNSDPQNATCTASWTTNTTTTCKIERDGGFASIEWNLALAGAPNATTLSVSLPAGMSVDMSRLVSVGAGFPIHGTASANRSGSATTIYVLMASTTSFYITYSSNTATWAQSIVSNTAPVTWAAGDNIMARIRVPITGWGSSQRISDGYDGRNISLFAYNATGPTLNTTSQKITFGTITVDTVGSFASSEFEAKTSDYYEIDAEILNSSNNVYIEVFKKPVGGSFVIVNEARSYSPTTKVNGSYTVYIKAGEKVALYAKLLSGTGNLDAQFCRLRITRRQAPQTISASDKVYLFYRNSSGQSIPSGTQTTVTNWTKTSDSHNAFNATTGIFTAPNAGTFEISAMITMDDATASSDRNVFIRDITNSLDVVHSIRPYTTLASGQISQNVNAIIDLVAGQQIAIQVSQSSGAAQNITATAARNNLSIKQVK